MARGTDMDAVVVREQRSSFKINDVVKLLEYPKVKGKPAWVTVRLFGPVYSQATFWVRNDRSNPRKKFPKIVRCYDCEQHKIVADKYDPFYDYYRQELDENVEFKNRLLQYSRYFYMQAIVRKLQDDMPSKNRMTAQEKKTHIKDPESESYTPVVVVRMTNKLFKAIQDLKEDNVVKFKDGKRTAYSVNHEKYGRDIMIRYDDSDGVAAGDRYQVKLVVDGGRTPLTDEEKQYLQWDMESIYPEEESENKIRQDFESWAKRMGIGKKRHIEDAEDENDSFDDDADDLEPKAKKSKKVQEDYDDDDDDLEEEPPKKAKKSKKTSLDNEDIAGDYDAFDEEEETPKKSKKKVKAVEEDEDEDLDDSDDSEEDDDDDFEEEPPKKKKVVKKKVEEEEEDEDDFDEDDFDEPAPKKTKKKVVKKKVEDDDDEDDDEDLDDSDW